MKVSATEINTVLQIWAVVGPLIAAAASAIWSRHNQIQDREYENDKDIRKEELEKEKYALDEIRERNKSHYEEVKQGLIEFMSSSHEYVSKRSDYLTNATQEDKIIAGEAYDKFIRSQQVVILLGDNNLANKSIAFWNATVSIPRSNSLSMDDTFKEKLETYRAARQEFTESAKIFLQSLHHAVQNESE